MRYSILSLPCLALMANPALTYQFITTNSLPSDSLSESCVDALVADLSCSRAVSAFVLREQVPVESLEEACTSECSAALKQWETKVAGSCGTEDVFNIDETEDSKTELVSSIPTTLYYHFNKTCIKDGERWCNVVAYEMAEASSTISPSSPTPNDPTQTGIDMCDSCLIRQLQFEAGSPLYDGFDLQESYSSLTESCSKTGFPLVTTIATTGTPTSTAESSIPSATCSGTIYKIKDADTCQSISESQNVATAWLLYDNGLPAFCSEFPAEGEELCIQNKCEIHVVKSNDTCSSIATTYGISQVQLYTWNPILGDACVRFSKSVGDTICVTPPGDDGYSTITSTTTSGPSVTPEPTAAPVPSNIANGTNENCATYYSVQPGDYCNLILMKYQITLDDFLFLNQGVNENCTNLYAEESYCVEPVGPINQYPGHPDYVPPTETISEVPYSDLPKATFTPPSITGLPTVLPLANGTRKDCFIYADGTDMQIDISFSFASSVCEVLANGWGVSLEELQTWNPSLQTNSTDCTPSEDYRYCMAAYNAASYTRTAQASATDAPAPIRNGTIEDCLEYQTVIFPMTCESVLARNEITIAEFYKWNPAVGSNCENLQYGYRYCIQIELPDRETTPTTNPSSTSTSATATSSATSTKPSAPGPTLDGTTDSCEKWHLVEDGDDCGTVTKEYDITLDEFREWNTDVSEDCTQGFWLGYAYCVGA